MNFGRLPTMCAILMVLCGCASVAGPTTDTITFAQMQMLNPGVDGEWILAEFPDAREVQRRPENVPALTTLSQTLAQSDRR